MLDYIILGILQGIFEWLPISSEGIIALTTSYLTELNPIDTALFLHLGTLLAVLIYFRKDWLELKNNKQLLKFLIIATIISLLIAYPIYTFITNITIGSTLLFITGLGLLITSYFHKTNKKIKIKFKNLALLTGLLQGLAVIPGLSRSGSTIFGLSLGDLEPKEILKISYMLSAPAVLASTSLILLKEPTIIQTWPALISSFLVGILTLHLLLKFAQKINFYKFTLTFAILCFIGAIINLL